MARARSDGPGRFNLEPALFHCFGQAAQKRLVVVDQQKRFVGSRCGGVSVSFSFGPSLFISYYTDMGQTHRQTVRLDRQNTRFCPPILRGPVASEILDKAMLRAGPDS